MTRKGVEYNLEISPYIYSTGGVDFHFSSKPHMIKFIATADQAKVDISKKLSDRWKLPINGAGLAMLVHYAKVETRGFLITIGSDKYTCLENLTIKLLIETGRSNAKSNDSTLK